MTNQKCINFSSTGLLPKVPFGICAAIWLACGVTPPVFADDAAGNHLSTIQIFQKVKDTYASMITYSDEGCVVTARGTVINFSTRLARTNFYLIEWQQTNATAGSGSQAVWFAGAGDFLQAEAGVQCQGGRKIALAHASAFSDGATATIPSVFFDLRWVEEPLEDLVFSVDRQSDDNVGGVSCYVFTKGLLGATNTLWIGKQDFLIRQVRTVISLEAMPDFTALETHTNIVLNQRFSRSDFVPSFPLYPSSED
jgi:hypothetical protein